MRYEGNIYRPPSEAYSLIVQVTVGCTHNACTFCEMYKEKQFRLKSFEDVLADLREARQTYRRVERIFFADGDALCMATDKLIRLLDAVRELFPECSRVGVYSRPTQILQKSPEELRALAKAGLGIAYIGAESGCDEVLQRVNKGETAQESIQAVQKIEAAGIKASVTFILGLGGKDKMEAHAVKTGQAISAMGASYVGLLSLMLTPQMPLYHQMQAGEFTPLGPQGTLEELSLILANTNCEKESVLRSNHASNWLSLAGVLPWDKPRLLEEVEAAKRDTSVLRPEEYRRL